MDDYGIGQRFVQVESNWICEDVRSHLLVIVEREAPSNEGSGQIPSPKLRTAQVYPVYTMMTLKQSLLQIKRFLFHATLKRFRCVGLRAPASVTLVVRMSDRLIRLSPSLLAMLKWAKNDARRFESLLSLNDFLLRNPRTYKPLNAWNSKNDQLSGRRDRRKRSLEEWKSQDNFFILLAFILLL